MADYDDKEELIVPVQGPAASPTNGKKGQQPKPAVRTELLSKEDVQDALDRTANKSLVLPLEHRLWTKQELELYIMSDGVVRPKWCSLPDETTLLDTQLTDKELEEALATAAEWISNADAILVGSGAGMGVDSRLATFRGGQGGVWPAFKDLGLSYEELCDTKWFQEDPRLGWAFWWFCHEAYREAQPHKGYEIVRKWADRSVNGGFSFTSNIDCHWARSGWREDRIIECHGSLRWLQCSVPCCEDVWEIPQDLELSEDPRTHRAVGDLPVCPKCGAVARPCILMFGGDKGFSRKERDNQDWYYQGWKHQVEVTNQFCPPPGATVVLIELGCGITVPTVRAELQKILDKWDCARLIRVNPENPGFTRALKGRAVSLPLGALEALQRIDEQVQQDEIARFILHDMYGNGHELHAPRSWPLHKMIRSFMFENPWTNGENESLWALANNIFQRDRTHHIEWQDPVPEELFLAVDGTQDPSAVCIQCYGGHFEFQNELLKARMAKVFGLLIDLIHAFQDESYQKQLDTVQDRNTLREMIREVHLDVLPRHGYQVSRELKPAQWMSIQQRMQAFIQSGDWWPELRKYADASQEHSGGWKMHVLPQLKPKKAKDK